MRSEFEKNRYWIGLYRTDVDFDESLGEFGRYVVNDSRRIDAGNLETFNEKWEAYANAWQHQQSKVDELEAKLQLCRTENKALLNKINNSELPKQLIEQGQRLNAQSQQIASLKWQLSKVGFTDNGGELMKPPLGDPPNYLSECEKLNRLG